MNPRIKRSGRRSMALVVTLVLVTLLSALIVAYTMRARLDLASAASYAAVPQADGIARGGVEFLVGWLRREIREGSDVSASGGGAAYAPQDDGNWLVQRTAERGGGGLPYQSLVKISKRGKQFFESGNGWSFGGGASFDVVSSVSTKDGSLNGRQFSPGRWTAPKLLTREEADADFDAQSANESTLPDWIYVTRGGPEKIDDMQDTRRDDSPENDRFVLGRFAYAVYDTSGLLDVNVAGYPGDLDKYLGDTGIVAKASLAWANPDVMQLPGSEGVDREGLVKWRNAATGKSVDFFYGYFTNAAKESFLTNAAGDNAFFGRSDLVAFAKSTTGRQILDTNALPYLTVFSREKNAPSWAPKNYEDISSDEWATKCNIEYGDKAFDEGATNRWAAGPLVQTDFLAPAPGRSDEFITDPAQGGIRFKAGEPLLKRRFPLSRIDLLRPGNKTGDQMKLIQYYFGLISGGAGEGGNLQWQYRPYGEGTSGELRRIYTLDEVAGKGREPNFFELIQAGVLRGSLGKTAQQKNADNNYEEWALNYRLLRDVSAIHQVWQIGANIIDQYDDDDYPTTIRSIAERPAEMTGLLVYNNQRVAEAASTIRGVENCPYISLICSTVTRDVTQGPPTSGPLAQRWKDPVTGIEYHLPPYVSAYTNDSNDAIMKWNVPTYPALREPNLHPWLVMFLHFQLWNPNRNAGDATPGEYRVGANSGYTYLRPPQGANALYGYASGPGRLQSGQQVVSSNPNSPTYRNLHLDRVDNWLLFGQLPRFGRDFRNDPSWIGFRTSAGKMLHQPRLLQEDDPYLEITDIENRNLDVLQVGGFGGLRPSMIGMQLGKTIGVCNLDTNCHNRFDFTELRDNNGDGTYSDPASTGPTVFSQQNLGDRSGAPIFKLQRKIAGEWVTIQTIVPRFSAVSGGGAFTLSGVPQVDENYTCYHQADRLDALYRRQWPFGSRYAVTSDPRCARFGFASSGGLDAAIGSTVNKPLPNWVKVGHRTLRYAQYKGSTGNMGANQFNPNNSQHGPSYSERLDPISGIWVTPWHSGPYKPIVFRPKPKPTEKENDQNPAGSSVEKNKEEIWYKDSEDVKRERVVYAELAENSQEQSRMEGESLMWTRDRDGIVRRGDGWRQRGVNPYEQWGNGVQPTDGIVARGIHLNRPFQSVAELGYVLRDDPWKTLNFFWRDSADAGLLDYFCLYEGEQFRPAVAGVVNPNTAPKEVLRAVLVGTALNAQVGSGDPPRMSDGAADDVAKAIRNYIGEIGRPNDGKMLRNKGDIVVMCEELFETMGLRERMKSEGSSEEQADTDTLREAIARALADVCNTRTWNLFVDVVAQSGRFTQASRSPKDFLVTGERRLWVHLALDRCTGEVVDMDIEPVFE